ncbi:hypothetical protein FJZ27_04210 [Candidatus Peribacteria bacterium]|nr:hypothetical protein [Candidatus Peribacteria bacterium]
MNIYCAGIGGIGLSAYAALMRLQGHEVSGSDRVESDLLDELRASGVQVTLLQDGSEIPQDCDLFVYSEALPIHHPERMAAERRGIRSLSYFGALGELSAPYDVIAVCGTHGKSSTTAMIAKTLIDAGKDPTVVVGTKLPDLGGRNYRNGKSKIFVLEACEYRKSFHALSPSTIVLTNVDGDHFDYYSTVRAYREAFVEFVGRLPPSGIVVLHGEDADALDVAQQAGRKAVDADLLPLPELSIAGVHMQQNARLALAMAECCGVPREDALRSLHGYRGAWRRMEYVGSYHDIPVIDDYGHHPREIAAVLGALRHQYGDRRIVCVFQPHTHDRTLKLYSDFTAAFSDADLVIIPGVYEARRDRDAATVDLSEFTRGIAQASAVDCLDGISLDATEEMLRTQILKTGDVLLVMGAGDVTGLARSMGRG